MSIIDAIIDLAYSCDRIASLEVKVKQTAVQSEETCEVLRKNFKKLVKSTLMLSFSRSNLEAY